MTAMFAVPRRNEPKKLGLSSLAMRKKEPIMMEIAHDIDSHESPMTPFGSHEMNFWHRVVAVYMRVLPDLEHDLQKAGKISFFEFQVLDHLSSERSQMSMTRLATRCNSSLSRLSHVARKLEGRGLLTRQIGRASCREGVEHKGAAVS